MFFVVSFLALEQQIVARTDEDEGLDDTGSIPPPKWPSHACRPREQGKGMPHAPYKRLNCKLKRHSLICV
jgi:hypothetical protein